MGITSKPEMKLKAFKLFEKNKLNQKQISKHLNVTEKTIGIWKKQFKAFKIFKTKNFDFQQMAQQFKVPYDTILNWKSELDVMKYEQEEEQNVIDYLQAIQKELTEIKQLIKSKK